MEKSKLRFFGYDQIEGDVRVEPGPRLGEERRRWLGTGRSGSLGSYCPVKQPKMDKHLHLLAALFLLKYSLQFNSALFLSHQITAPVVLRHFKLYGKDPTIIN